MPKKIQIMYFSVTPNNCVSMDLDPFPTPAYYRSFHPYKKPQQKAGIPTYLSVIDGKLWLLLNSNSRKAAILGLTTQGKFELIPLA